MYVIDNTMDEASKHDRNNRSKGMLMKCFAFHKGLDLRKRFIFILKLYQEYKIHNL